MNTVRSAWCLLPAAWCAMVSTEHICLPLASLLPWHNLITVPLRLSCRGGGGRGGGCRHPRLRRRATSSRGRKLATGAVRRTRKQAPTQATAFQVPGRRTRLDLLRSAAVSEKKTGPPQPPGAGARGGDESSSNGSSTNRPHVAAHPTTLLARQRTVRSIRRYQQQRRQLLRPPLTPTAARTGRAAFWGDDDNNSGDADGPSRGAGGKATSALADDGGARREREPRRQAPEPSSSDPFATTSKVTSFTYRGMSVTFGTTPPSAAEAGRAPARPARCYGACSRTRSVFQTLELPSLQHHHPVVALVSHPTTGQIALAQADGSVRT